MPKATSGPRLIVYQPNHGIGVEMALVDAAARLGKLLDRTIVLPQLPILDTLDYQGGIDEYFELNPDMNWVSTEELLRRGAVIDRLFHLIPYWKPDFKRQIVRDLHPVWVRNISRYEYFPAVGLRVREVSRREIHHPLCPETVREMFASDAPVIGFSFINGLIADNVSRSSPPDDKFRWLDYAPPHPRREFLEAVKVLLGQVPDIALHVRRANQEMARAIDGTELPPIAAYCEYISPDIKLAYIATEMNEVFHEISQKVPAARRITTGHHIRDAVLDIAACTLAERFVGTHCSTFSMYIVHARSSIGKDPGTTVLLR
jgi:hypothetical protein